MVQLIKTLLIENIVSKTWQYAKKQIKWFKKENIDLIVDITNLDPNGRVLIVFMIYTNQLIKNFINNHF